MKLTRLARVSRLCGRGLGRQEHASESSSRHDHYPPFVGIPAALIS
jgi:hypothetical protein